MTDRIVYGYGSLPNDVMVVGEAPGKEEAYKGHPFVGKSGQEQETYFNRNDLSAHYFYKTNVVKLYIEKNPDPTPELVAEWTPTLLSEIQKCKPKVIIPVGRFACRFFLGDNIDMEAIHGIPHRAGTFDPSRADRGRGAVIVPCYHPAFGLYDADMKQYIDYDYYVASDIIKKAKRGRLHTVKFPVDEYAGIEVYEDITGKDVEDIVDGAEEIALDTEGSISDPWSIQICTESGMSYVLRCSWSDFDRGIRSLQEAIDRKSVTTIFHNSMFDLGMCRAMGLNFDNVHIWDSMYAAYLLRREPQGLKPLAYRWVGMRMKSYEDVIGDVGIGKQLDYLEKVIDREWPEPERREEQQNDGTIKSKKPQRVEKTASRIIADYHSGKVNKDGERTDPMKRWKKVDGVLRKTVEKVLGPMPVGTLADIDQNEAIRYAARDSDATLRLYYALS